MSAQESVPDEDTPEQLVTMSASVILTQLPKDATSLLEAYANPPSQKIQIRFKAIGSAPILKNQVYKISSDQKFSALVRFLRRQLRYKQNESLFCYVNSSFAPSLDEMIGNLFQNFAVDSQLMVSYCTTVAFG